MGNEKHFDENVIAYDKYRPTYGAEIYRDIISYAVVTKDNRILEIGCGTGNATLPFIKTGAYLTAVELGKNLACYTARKFCRHDNFHICNTSFERFETDMKFDLIISATAFHWIKSDFGYPRCRELLNENGTLALFWNTPRISDENPDLKSYIRELYEQYMPDDAEEKEALIDSPWYKKRCDELNRNMEYYGYSDCIFILYSDSRCFTADEYIGLLHTYSDHMALPDNLRHEFFGKIHKAISEYGTVAVKDTIDLHMGRVK